MAELQPARDLSYSPLFQVMFILQNTPMPPRECGSLRFSSYEVDAGSSKLDLTLNLEQTENGCEGWIEYASDLFDRATILRMIVDFKALLARIAADPEQKLSELTSPFAPSQNRAQSPAATVVLVPAEIPSVRLAAVDLTPSRRADLPMTPAEKELARIWSEVLGAAEIRRNDNLFDLGGHSLLVTRIISRIRTSFDVEVPIHAFFETPTLGAIADSVERTGNRQRAAVPG